MRHIRAYKLAATYKMTLMYFLVNIHINNQSTLYKVNGVASNLHFVILLLGTTLFRSTLTPQPLYVTL
jgi:hypothetical protein